MSTWMKLLPLELDGIKGPDFIEPDQELRANDSPVGTMSDIHRRLYTLGKLLEKDAKQCALDANFCNDKTKKLELEAKALEYATKSSIVKELMWAGIRDEFGLWHENTGVRTDFRVVVTSGAEGALQSFIRELLGGL